MNFINFIKRILRFNQNPPLPPMPTPVPTPPVSDIIEEIKQQLFSSHNQERLKKGLSPYGRNTLLDKAAQKHCDYMAVNNHLTHDERGVRVGVRITREGYVWKTCGENIAEGQESVNEVMNSWMNSSGHKANILGDFLEVGFGVTKRDNVLWWVVNFASKG